MDKAHYRRSKKLRCHCPGVPYPHERGTLVRCEQYAGEVSYEDWCDYMDRLKEAAIKAA